MNKFYPLTPLMTNRLRKADLTAAEWRLWSYLIELDPWGDRYQELPDVMTILQVVGIRKSTFYSGIAKLQKAGLFDFQSRGFDFRNLCGAESSKNSENFPRTRKTFRKNGNDSEILENRPPKPAPVADSKSSQTIQTIQTLSYSSDPHPPTPEKEEREEGKNAKEENARADGKGNGKVICEKPKSLNSSVTINKNPGIERSSAPVVRTQSNELHWALVYADDETPWLEPSEKGKRINFRYPFLEWHGKRWMQKYEKQDIHDAIGDFRRSLLNDPNKIEIAWDEYQNQVLHHAANIQTRIENGCAITGDEQDKMKKHLPQIVNQPVKNENCLEATIEEVSPNVLRQPQDGAECGRPSELLRSPSLRGATQLPPCTTQENSSAYQLWQPPQPEPEAEEETVNVFKELGAFLKGGIKSMPARQPVQERNHLEELNEWMQDDILREEAIRKVKASDRYTFEYDDDGSPMSVIEPEF